MAVSPKNLVCFDGAPLHEQQAFAELCGNGGKTDSLCQGDGLHPYRDFTDSRISVRTVLGLSGIEFLCVDLAPRQARTGEVGSAATKSPTLKR